MDTMILLLKLTLSKRANMKIHRDNTKVALTQEMKDEVFEREQEKIKEAERQLNAKIKKDEEAKKN